VFLVLLVLLRGSPLRLDAPARDPRAQEPAVRSAKSAGKSFKTVEEVWQFLDKKPCCGRYAYDRKKGSLICGPCIKADHDKTCNRDTCLFIASGLECPVPTDAFKE
ncbi:unnamed protein product, partial [Prorocentrum cordatum]